MRVETSENLNESGSGDFNGSLNDSQDFSQKMKQGEPFIIRLIDIFIDNNISDFLPNISKLIRKYLTILVSSTTPER